MPSPRYLVDPSENGSLVIYYPPRPFSSSSSEPTSSSSLPTKEEGDALLATLSDIVPWEVRRDDYGIQRRPTCYMGDERCFFSFVGCFCAPRPFLPEVHGLRRRLEAEVVPEVQRLLISRRGRRKCQLEKKRKQVPKIMDKKEEGEENTTLSGVLLNQYKAGEGFIPWHSDEVRAHGSLKLIVTVSCGGPRTFLLRRKRADNEAAHKRRRIQNESEAIGSTAQWETSLELESGSILVMAGTTQDYYEHALPLSPPLTGDVVEKNTAAGKKHTKTGAIRRDPARISLTFRTIVPGYEQGPQEEPIGPLAAARNLGGSSHASSSKLREERESKGK